MWHNPASWFEMRDLCAPRLSNSTWIPLLSRHKYINVGEFGADGYIEDYFQAQAICVPAEYREEAIAIGTSDMNVTGSHRPYVEGGEWYSAGCFQDWQTDCFGNYLILEQSLGGMPCSNYLIDQDLILGLGLIQEGDQWLCPSEDFEVVIRTSQNKVGEKTLIEIKSNFLKDFLCAKKSGLVIGTYRSRTEIHYSPPKFELCTSDDHILEGDWEGGIKEIDESGAPYGSTVGVVSVWVEGVEELGDVPVVPVGERTRSKTAEFVREGKKLYLVQGELWRNEWIESASSSPRVRRDHVRANVRFTIDANGATEFASDLKGERRWLWFRPRIIQNALAKRGAKLTWFTQETGSILTLSTNAIHFGINSEGLINIFAKDIGELSESGQMMWAAENVAPCGPPSQELLDSQMRCDPARTRAPETLLKKSLERLQYLSHQAFGRSLLNHHETTEELSHSIHRFRSLSRSEFYSLAKDLNRFVIERLDVPLLRSLTPEMDKATGSIKRVGKLLSAQGADGRLLTSVLVGLNELRQADAHLSSADINDAMALVNIRDNGQYLFMGRDLIGNVAACISNICNVLFERFDKIE